jgi:hypothetical protein
MKLVYFLLFVIVPTVVLPQTIKLRGRVMEETGGTIGSREEKPVSDLTLRFVHYGDCSTTRSGEFIISVPPNVDQLEVEIKNDTTWILRYPRKPFPVPANLNHITYIYVSRAAHRLTVKQDE